VRLTAVASDSFDATHDLDPEAGLFAVGVTSVERPLPGRLAELHAAHREACGKPPSVAKDKDLTDEKSLSTVPTRRVVETARYSPRRATVTAVPWPQVITIPMAGAIPERDRIGWAVAAHRALIKIIGFGAPPVITGAYPAGTRRPANRLAIHLIDARDGRNSRLAILVPAAADPVDLDALSHAVGNLISLRGPRGKLMELKPDEIEVVDGGQFWLPPQPGHIRLWRTVPAAVPDTRGSRDSEWNFAHAALLSLGFVWKERLPRVSGRGDDYYRALATAASDAGAAVVHARAIRTSGVDRYVHKINEHAVVRPYTAVISLGKLAGPRTIQAIGQSRHLGGGLLVPFDVPEGIRTGDVILPDESEA
jgi:CRISPR-associated protein Csb2